MSPESKAADIQSFLFQTYSTYYRETYISKTFHRNHIKMFKNSVFISSQSDPRQIEFEGGRIIRLDVYICIWCSASLCLSDINKVGFCLYKTRSPLLNRPLESDPLKDSSLRVAKGWWYLSKGEGVFCCWRTMMIVCSLFVSSQLMVSYSYLLIEYDHDTIQIEKTRAFWHIIRQQTFDGL